ncbi:hypothetical protein N7492_007449 [Penicillium capsulatum]|uniref:Centromere protein X n=1 Tax=Penicillium capsulatum TaxID=69766 RepID=A0A9W9I2I6_9EURO|nr:hypothetical protein N7492_007449 [Penicillium capsulatum]
MAGEPQAAQKKRRLPFKPPSRASTTAEPSSSTATATGKGKGKGKESTTKSTSKGTSKPSSSTSTSTSKPNSKRKATSPESTSNKRPRPVSPPSNLPATPSDFASDSEPESPRPDRERTPSEEPDYILAEIVTRDKSEDVALGDPAIPRKLLTRLLLHHFANEKTRLAKDADGVMAKYVDVFVREAIARASLERAETNEAAGTKSVADGFLEVEDLEKLAPQLIMDF